jgi:hypothetical protein
LSRYGCFSDTSYRNNFEKSFDFGKFNGEHIKQKGTGHQRFDRHQLKRWPL